MSALEWILIIVLAFIYITMAVMLGAATWGKGHYVLFWLGIFVPILWIFGALTPGPKDAYGT